MKQWLSKVNSYSIEFPDRPNCVFWTGENVKGVLRLVTNSPITCRCVNVKLTGQSYTHWTYQSGDNTEHAYGHKNYLTRRITGWGNFYKTECLSGAGTDAYFGGTPGDGDMFMPLSQPVGSFKVAVRVMDYDWGKKDDLLGEILLDPQVLLVQPGVPISFALNRKGKPGKGEVTLSATLTNQTQLQQTAISAGALTSGAQLLRVVCHQATGLKSGDMFSKNDVYVQSYFVPIGTDASKALPVPEKNMQLPVGKYVIPFEFKIPNGNLPSSCEASGFDWDVHEAYVRW
jgi:hypothetical protein